jgi:hypothetical protein
MAETKKETKQYEVLTELTYPDADGKSKTVKVGSVVSDIPAASIKWLLAQNVVKEI